MAARSALRGTKQERAAGRSTAEGWLFLIVAILFGILLFYVATSRSASWRSRAPTGLRKQLLRSQSRSPVRRLAPKDIFGTIHQSELSAQFQALTDKPKLGALNTTLRKMKESGVNTVIFSISWDWAEPEEGKVRYSYLDMLMDAACHNASLKVNFAVDLVNPPKWIWKRYPDAVSYDADGRKYVRLTWFHALGNAAARRFLTDVATHLAGAYSTCIVALQPVYNNAYQAKYTQEYDAFQDYSPYALLEYRNWLQRKGMPLQLLNVRWNTQFKRWAEVKPPQLHAGDFLGVDFSARYWDWLRFREEFGAEVYTSACMAVISTGLQCFHRVSEFFSVVDAIYSAAMFKRVAASPATSFLIMDTNFVTPYGTPTKPSKLQLYISAARIYGKPVYSEAVLGRSTSADLLSEAFRSALMAGADAVGMSNWLTQLGTLNVSLVRASDSAPQCEPDELVGVFIHLDSCSAFHGLQWGWARTDPLHDFIESLAERLSARCETEVAVYVELSRFLADVSTFSRAIFVEPLLLYDNGEFTSYLAAKAALMHVTHEVLRLPANVTSGPQLVVLQDVGPMTAAFGGGASVVAAAAHLVGDAS